MVAIVRGAQRASWLKRVVVGSVVTGLLSGMYVRGVSATAVAQPEIEQLAVTIAADLAQARIGTSRAEWRTAVPTAEWRDRRGFLGYSPPGELDPLTLWCSKATDRVGVHLREAVFYGFRHELPQDCRLEQVMYVIGGSSNSPESFATFARTLGARFENQFDKRAFDRLPDTGRSLMMMTGLGSSLDISDLVFWMAPTRLVFLVQANSGIYVVALSYVGAEATRQPEVPAATQRNGVDLLTWELVNALRPIDPESVELILSNEAIASQESVERAVLHLLERRARAEGDQRAMLSIAAGLLAPRLRYVGESWRKERPGVRALVPYGIKMEESPFDGGIWYGSSGLMDEVRLGRPGTRWGQLVFLHRLSSGWNDFPDGRQYRSVIDQGTAWLKTYPGSPFAATVTSHIARAYETWWSLSLAIENDDDMVTPSEHVAGSAEARLQAIRWYEKLLREAPSSIEARHAQRVLIQIKVGVDTGARIFYEVYA